MELTKNRNGLSVTLAKGLLLTAAAISLTACGGSSSDDDNSSNSTPVVGVNNVTVQSGETATYGLDVTDADGDALTYTITTEPARGTASIDEDGTITYAASNYIGTDSLVIEVSDGDSTVDAEVAVTLQSDAVFDYQFYQVENPDVPGTYQIVRYDPNDADESTNQVVVKQGAILSDRVFVMSGAKSEDSTVYLKREYAVFQEQGSFEVRQTADETPVEYTFYTDTVLKTFDASNTNLESVIYRGSMLTDDMTDQGVNVISGDFDLHTTETDIDNSYVQLKAFDELPDLLLSEVEGDKTQLPLVVRISDSTAIEGRLLSTVLNDNGEVEKVLINELGAYSDDTFDSVAKTLKVCDAALTACTAIDGTDGSYYFLTKNDSTIYVAKEGDETIYAFSTADDSVTAVTGVSYPAEYDGVHHQIAFNGGHGGSGIFSNFYNMTGVIDSVSDEDTSYFLINYNLDTQDAVGVGAFSFASPYVHKNAMILKLTGTEGVTVYDNGTGEDLKDESDDVTLSFNMSLTAVREGYLFIETSKFNGPDETSFTYQTGWLDTDTDVAKTELDSTVVDKDIPYFTGIRVPPVAVGDHVYVNEDTYLDGETSGTANRIYNIYKMPLDNPMLDREDASVEKVTGRMYFERSAYRTTGVYTGNVLLWDRHNDGTITNATTGEIMGVVSEDIDETITNVYASDSGNSTLAGIGGLFGLHMPADHGATPFLASGESATAGSLTAVNQIEGTWITD